MITKVEFWWLHYTICAWMSKPHHALSDASYCTGDRPFALSRVGRKGMFLSYGNPKEGQTNMGHLTMQITKFMSEGCGWAFQSCNWDNLGFVGEIHEQLLTFRAADPSHPVVPYLMIELREAGYIEVNCSNVEGIFANLTHSFKEAWKAEGPDAIEGICDLQCTSSAFTSTGLQDDCNMGRCTMQLVEFMAHTCSWTLTFCSPY